MRKLLRNSEKFDVLELFASMAAEQGYDLRDPMAQDDFIERIRTSIEKSKKNSITIFGKRIESLFAYVAGALGKVARAIVSTFSNIQEVRRCMIQPEWVGTGGVTDVGD